MSIFEKASRLGEKCRFKTDNGVLSVEDLWNVQLSVLDSLAKCYRRELHNAEDESFIAPTQTKENELLVLKFELVKHVIKVRLDEKAELEAAAKARLHDYKIDQLIAEKQDQALRNLSIEELQALRSTK